MWQFIRKVVMYCFVGSILLVVIGLLSGTDESDKPQAQKATAKAEKAEVEVQSLSDLQKQQDALIAQRQKIWDQQDALYVDGKLTDEEKLNALGEVENQLYEVIVGLSEKIVKAKNQQRENAQAQVKKQFSGWDGSHRGLVAMTKKEMHDPKSFEHVETRSWLLNNGTTLRVQMKYRGNNVFGHPVIDIVKADFDMNGNFVQFVK